MNHSHYGVYNRHTTLVLGHWKFAVDKFLTLWAQGLSYSKGHHATIMIQGIARYVASYSSYL